MNHIREGDHYIHKDGGEYVVAKTVKHTLSNDKCILIIEYFSIDDPEEYYVRTEKHFKSSFKPKENNNES
jgi:hypothetical protein